MKIIDKIVKQTTEPKQKNVLWLNPKTGELKIFGNNGWETVGGTPGEGGGSGGYPVVTIEDDFNIEAKPNTFYNIKNTTDAEVSINFKPEEFYATGKSKHIMFIWDNFSPDNEIILALLIGGIVVEDNSVEGYKYRMDVDGSSFGTGIMPVYLSDNITEGVNIRAYINMLGVEQILELNNIHIINKDIDYLHYISFVYGGEVITTTCVILEEVENDSEFKHKYKYHGLLNMVADIEYFYTNESYDKATSVFIYNGDENYIECVISKVLNKDIEPSNIVNEFVFNINSPANIVFNNEVKWNGGNTPDLTQTGNYTISILNGIGCYTFVNS